MDLVLALLHALTRKSRSR